MNGDKNKWLNGCDDGWRVGKKQRVMVSHPQEHQLWNVRFVKKWVWLLQVWAQLLTNVQNFRFAFTLQYHLVPMLLENVFVLYIYIYIYIIYIYIHIYYIYIYLHIHIYYIHIYLHIHIYYTGPVLESKGMCANFQKKSKKRAEYLKNWAKMYNIWKYRQRQRQKDRETERYLSI